MSEIDLEPSHRRQIERLVGRPLTNEERRSVASVEELSEAHREIIRRLGTRPLGLAYLVAAVPRLHEPTRALDRIVNGMNWISVQPWSHESGLGRWRFRIPPVAGEDAASTVRRSVDIIVAKAAPFGRVQLVPSREVPAELVLDLFVETDEGPRVLQSVAGITFAIVDGAVELVLLLDVDIHAYVTLKFIDNTELATVNAPRLEYFLALLRNQLHAELIVSDGLLPADEAGFTRR